jgi:hypothetical protein
VAAPFLSDALRDGEMSTVSYMSNCETCAADAPDPAARQSRGCGWLPALPEGEAGGVWSPAGRNGPPLTVCAGYTVRLPQVREVMLARADWENGTLTARCDGELPTTLLLDALRMYEGASAELRESKRSKGGG